MSNLTNDADIIDVEVVESSEQASTSFKEKCSCAKEKLPKITKAKQIKIVKAGLATTLALTTVSAVAKFPYSKKLHKAAGLAMVGFACLHISQLHRPKKKKKVQKLTTNA